MSDSIDPARWLSDELANRDKRIEDLETRLHTSREAEVEEIVADVVDGRLRFTRETVLDIARRAVQAGREPLLKRIEELERQVQRLVQVARDVITERDSAKAEGYAEGLEAIKGPEGSLFRAGHAAGRAEGAHEAREACACHLDRQARRYRDTSPAVHAALNSASAAIRARGDK